MFFKYTNIETLPPLPFLPASSHGLDGRGRPGVSCFLVTRLANPGIPLNIWRVFLKSLTFSLPGDHWPLLVLLWTLYGVSSSHVAPLLGIKGCISHTFPLAFIPRASCSLISVMIILVIPGVKTHYDDQSRSMQ